MFTNIAKAKTWRKYFHILLTWRIRSELGCRRKGSSEWRKQVPGEGKRVEENGSGDAETTEALDSSDRSGAERSTEEESEWCEAERTDRRGATRSGKKRGG
jgi:hypothetical protein